MSDQTTEYSAKPSSLPEQLRKWGADDGYRGWRAAMLVDAANEIERLRLLASTNEVQRDLARQELALLLNADRNVSDDKCSSEWETCWCETCDRRRKAALHVEEPNL